MKSGNIKAKSLYIHIPFCDRICSYCVFATALKNDKFVSKYIDSLIEEIDKFSSLKFQTVYIGGGTPTSIDSFNLERLLKKIDSLNLESDFEFSIESNPENLTLEKCDLLKKYNVNRVSIGVQSFDDNDLKFLNRTHTFDDVKNAIDNLIKVGITNINLDLIYGLPRQGFKEFSKNIDITCSYPIKHLSLYALEIDYGSKLYANHFKEIDQDSYADIYEKSVEYLSSKYGFHRYEVSNFALDKNSECKHNKCYWHFDEYVGVGLNATSFYDHKFVIVTNNLSKYCNRDYNYKEEVLSKHSEMETYIMENLRLEEGMSLEKFQNRFGEDFIKLYEMPLKNLSSNLLLSNGNIAIKKDKIYVMNSILTELLDFEE